MAFCFVVGTHDFTGPLTGYESTTAQCHNCGNWSARCISSWNWFTFCFVPVIPLGSKHKDIACSICHFRQDLRNRPDVQSQIGGGGAGGPPPQQGGAPPPGGHQGWGGGGGGHGGPPPPQGQPQYK